MDELTSTVLRGDTFGLKRLYPNPNQSSPCHIFGFEVESQREAQNGTIQVFSKVFNWHRKIGSSYSVIPPQSNTVGKKIVESVFLRVCSLWLLKKLCLPLLENSADKVYSTALYSWSWQLLEKTFILLLWYLHAVQMKTTMWCYLFLLLSNREAICVRYADKVLPLRSSKCNCSAHRMCFSIFSLPW